jgi:hypothetical protein
MQDYPSVLPTAAVRLELEGPIFVMLEDWRRAQSKIPSRSEAVRLLLALALSAHANGPSPPKIRRPSTPSAAIVALKTKPARS